MPPLALKKRGDAHILSKLLAHSSARVQGKEGTRGKGPRATRAGWKDDMQGASMQCARGGRGHTGCEHTGHDHWHAGAGAQYLLVVGGSMRVQELSRARGLAPGKVQILRHSRGGGPRGGGGYGQERKQGIGV